MFRIYFLNFDCQWEKKAFRSIVFLDPFARELYALWVFWGLHVFNKSSSPTNNGQIKINFEEIA